MRRCENPTRQTDALDGGGLVDVVVAPLYTPLAPLAAGARGPWDLDECHDISHVYNLKHRHCASNLPRY